MQIVSGYGGAESEEMRRYAAMRSLSAPIPAVDDRETVPPISSQRLQLASASIRFLSHIIRQLNELRQEDESDGHGVLRATEDAYDLACQIVTDAAITLAGGGLQVPRGLASTDSTGGVRIEWSKPNASVRLVISNGKRYVYREFGAVFGTTPATTGSLAKALREFQST